MQIDLERIIDRSSLGPLQWRVLVLCALVTLLDGYDLQAMASATPALAADWGVTPASLRWVITAALIGVAVSALLLSPLGDYLWHREAPSDAVVTDSAGNIIALRGQSLIKFDASGAELWRRKLTDTRAPVRGMTTYRDGRIALVGDFMGEADFGTGPLTATGKDGFAAVLAP